MVDAGCLLRAILGIYRNRGLHIAVTGFGLHPTNSRILLRWQSTQKCRAPTMYQNLTPLAVWDDPATV
jgi:hypothetical protein